MSQDQERWLAMPEAIRRLAARLVSSETFAAAKLADWFFDERIRFKAAEVRQFMPVEYLDLVYFPTRDPDEEARYRELYGHSHPYDLLESRQQSDALIDSVALVRELLDAESSLWSDGELALTYRALHPDARVSYYGVTVSEGDLERCMALLPDLVATECPNDGEAIGAALARGRPPANWWPDFTRELVIDIHENGMPENQSALIARVQARFSNAGKPEPSRSQIQPVIREIFAAIGPAGNSKP